VLWTAHNAVGNGFLTYCFMEYTDSCRLEAV